MAKNEVEKDEVSLKDLVISIREWLIYLLSKKKIIILSLLVGFGVGLLYSVLSTVKYIANTTFVLESRKSSGDYSSIAVKFGLATSSGSGLFQDDENIMAFIKSRTMISKSLYTPVNSENPDKLLVHRYFNLKNYSDEWADKPQLKNIKFHVKEQDRSRLEDSIISVFHVDILNKYLSVSKPDKEQDIIALTTHTPDEVFSKFFNEALLENVIEFYIKGQTKKLSENVEILQHQADSVRTELNIALSGAAVSTDANPNLNPAFQRLRVPTQKRQVDVEINKSMLEELVKNLELSKITLRKETPLIQVIDRPVMPLERKKPGLIKSTIGGALLFTFIYIIFISSLYFYNKLMSKPTP